MIMTIGMLLPSLLMTKRYDNRIYAVKPLFMSLVYGLQQRGHRVIVYSASESGIKAELISGNACIEQKDLWSVKVRTDNSDIVHAITARMNMHAYEIDLVSRAYHHAKQEDVSIMHVYNDFIAHAIASFTSIPTVYTLHDPVYPNDSLEGYQLDRYLHDQYIAISNRQKELYEQRGARVVGMVYHGMDISMCPFQGSPEQHMIFAGRMIPEKGVVEALSVSQRVDIPLCIYSSENYKQTSYYKEKIAPLIISHTLYQSYLQPPKLYVGYGKAKVLLFPIDMEEPFGLVMIEAMACGTPVIAYNRGSVPELVKDGVTGFIIDPDDENRPGKGSWMIKKHGIDGLVEAVRRIGEIDRTACRKHVEENFTVKKMVDGYERVYAKVLSG